LLFGFLLAALFLAFGVAVAAAGAADAETSAIDDASLTEEIRQSTVKQLKRKSAAESQKIFT
jgi:hypothetical protein